MQKLPAEFYVFARVSSSNAATTVRLEAVAPQGEPNHLPILLYDFDNRDAYELWHRSGTGLRTPTVIEVSAADDKNPTNEQMRTAAAREFRNFFPGLALSNLPTTGSYWTGSYWIRPQPAQFAAGFIVLDGNGDPVEQTLSALDVNNARADLILDFVVLVQGNRA